jgi:hypothetical protein
VGGWAAVKGAAASSSDACVLIEDLGNAMMIQVRRAAAVNASSALSTRLAQVVGEGPIILIGYCETWQDGRK